MRYIGNKRRLLPFIHEAIIKNNVTGRTFCDLFSGTATVANYFKKQGFDIISNDLLYCSYVQQYVKIKISNMPSFAVLANELKLTKFAERNYAQAVINYLNNMAGIEGYIYHHFSPSGTASQPIKRMYFTDENAQKIDAIRELIEAWRQLDLVTENEFYVLLYALLDSVSKCANTTGKQNGFLKHFEKNALKSICLQLPVITQGSGQYQIHCEDSLDLIDDLPEVDVLYLDPPYTRTQYVSAYHLLETIARWDYSPVSGVIGMRDATGLKSAFNQKSHAFDSLKKIVTNARYKNLLLSYSSDSIVSHQAICDLLAKQGELKIYTRNLARYTSSQRNKQTSLENTSVQERLYYLKAAKMNSSRSDLGLTLEQLRLTPSNVLT